MRRVALALLLLTGGTTVGLADAAPVPVGAAPVETVPDKTVAPSRAAGSATDVTLLTGDVVRYSVLADGRATAEVVADNGRPTSYDVVADSRHVYVTPQEARPYVESGRIDPALFDVRYLVAHGYGNRRSTTVPVIAGFAGAGHTALAKAAKLLPASEPSHVLRSIDAVAMEVRKPAADRFWQAVMNTVPGRERLLSDVRALWLDRTLSVALDESVPQVGAPQAWEQGYDGTGVTVAVLDTGVDAQHPDLVGQVDAARSFLPSGSTVDGHGHGTHVAATVAGTGAGSDGTRPGVAPGARLVIGKVLDDAGNGTASQLIDGMEWASMSAGADVVNISLGGTPTTGTDPLSLALNQLSSSTGVLFVVAAGNDGPAAGTVGTPGTADAALTVAAVDGQDQVADFSSRGPRRINQAIKPEIAAPGVDITAARAAGTAMGTPDDELYTTASGTSMATPHVAGAAAILKQRHPDWTATELKRGLTSTAHDVGASVYAQGTGRLDVARAVAETVFATPTADFGGFFGDDAPTARDVTYRNTGTEPVALDLDLTVSQVEDGQPAPSDMFGLGATQVIVPAGGAATVQVELRPTIGPGGPFGGLLTATDDSGAVRATTAVGGVQDPRTLELTVDRLLPSDQQWSTGGQPNVYSSEVDTPRWPPLRVAPTRFRVVPGSYDVFWQIASSDTPYLIPDVVYGAVPEVEVEADRTVVVDFRTRVPVETMTDRPGVDQLTNFGLYRTYPGGGYRISGSLGRYASRVWMTPTDPVDEGVFRFYSHHQRIQRPVVMSAGDGLSLRPEYPDRLAADGTPMLAGRDRVPVVFAGQGAPGDYADVEAEGALVLLRAGDDPCASYVDEAAVAQEHGAVAVLLYGPAAPSGSFSWFSCGFRALRPGQYTVPMMALPSSQGEALRSAVARRRTTIRYEGTPDSPFRYDVRVNLGDNGLPDDARTRVRDRRLLRARTTLAAASPGPVDLRYVAVMADEPFGASYAVANLTSQRAYLHLVGPVGSNVGWLRRSVDKSAESEGDWEALSSLRATTATESWGGAPVQPGPLWRSAYPEGERCTGLCRTGDLLVPAMYASDADGHFAGFNSEITWSGQGELHLYDGGEEILLEQLPLPGSTLRQLGFRAPERHGDYRLTLDWVNPRPAAANSSRVEAEWGFTGSADAGPGDGWCGLGDDCQAQPLAFVDYEFELDPANRASSRVPQRGEVHVRYAPGVESPTVTSLRLWASYDRGATWRRVPVVGGGAGDYLAIVPAPRPGSGADTVSLRAVTADDAGGSLDSTVIDAYRLR